MAIRILVAALLGSMLGAAAEPARAPVLVELFTSEGCSSCPPADRLLEALDTQVVVLSEHVDYWDRLGWRDPYSSHANTLRQESYARAFGTEGPYTPEMVIDGAVEFVGNDSRRAADEIARAHGREKVGVRLTRTGAGVRIEIGPGTKSGDVVQAPALVLPGRHLRRAAIVGQGEYHIGRFRSRIDLDAYPCAGPRQADADLLAAACPCDLVGGPPAVVAHEFDRAIDHHLRRIRSLCAERTRIRFLAKRARMRGIGIAPAQAVPVIDMFAEHHDLRIERLQQAVCRGTA